MLQLSQQQKLQQKLSPQQIQYIRLLQLPQIALEQAIKAEIEINPALEEGPENEAESADEPMDAADSVLESMKEETPADDPLNDILPQSDTPSSSGDDEFSWEDYIQTDDLYGFKTDESMGRGGEDEDRPDYTPVQTVTFHDRLWDQVRLLSFSEKEMKIAEHLLGSADPDGYLRIEPDKLADDFVFNYGVLVTPGELEKVRKQILNLDPPGFLSRDLQECLLVQLENMEVTETSENATDILRHCYDEFTRKHFDAIMRMLQLEPDELKLAFELIQRLNPKPGEDEMSPGSNYITPDFFVEIEDGEARISLNDRGIPSLRINKKYAIMARFGQVDEQARSFIRKKVEDAKFFRQSIIQRRETMLKVMSTIVEQQMVFFETGSGLRPMILKDIADRIRMDISTVSRVVNSKYVQTEFGVYSLKHFFSEGIETESGEEASNREVKERIREIIQAEDGKRPLSDDKIADMLNEKGYNIARRTVTKYRESMNIPVARLRKTI
ncbi:MAG: RNA polymerase factor sigma-54 [Bacteroidetes bacterium]|nr:RNA polymerase factor sigma-54 [Bacteroidota bacterium]